MKKLPLSVSNLRFSYGEREVLRGIQGDFYQGTFYGIAGPNGSGKTTMLKLLAGLKTSKTSSAIQLLEKPLSTYSRLEMAKHIAYVPQMFDIPYAYTIEEVVKMGRYPYTHDQRTKGKDHEIVAYALQKTQLFDMKDRLVNALSGGELQRVIIARAIAQDTDIILLDEPISHLDIHYQRDLVHLMKKLCQEEDKTIIAVLHDLNITMNHCDHLFLLKDGQIVKQGEPAQVLTSETVAQAYGIDVSILMQDDQRFITWNDV